jgi:hypothetical protein
MAALVGFAAIFLYDGYFSKYKWSMRYSFYEEHVLKKGGIPDDTMIWNQKWLPVICLGCAAMLGAYLFAIHNRKVVAEENALIVNNNLKIAYDSIQKIDKTNFDAKGHFTFTYRGTDGKETDRKLSDRDYDNLRAILDHLVSKIS